LVGQWTSSATARGLPSYRREVFVTRRHQRPHQQGAQSPAELVLLLDPLEFADALAVLPN
jgi:hypothetical protein